RRFDPDAELGMARSRQRNEGSSRLDGRSRHSAGRLIGSNVFSVLFRTADARESTGQRLSTNVRPRAHHADVGQGEAASVTAVALLVGAALGRAELATRAPGQCT